MIQSGGAADMVFGDLGRVADHQNIGLDDGRHLLVSFVRCRQQDVDRSDQGAAGGAIQGLIDLSEKLTSQNLVADRRCRRHRVSYAVDQFPAFIIGPLPVVGIGKAVSRGSRQSHAIDSGSAHLGIVP